MNDPQPIRKASPQVAAPSRASTPHVSSPSVKPSAAEGANRRDAEKGPSTKSPSLVPWVGGIIAVAAAGYLFFGGGSAKLGENSPNWQYHEGLSKGEYSQVTRQGKQVVRSIQLGSADVAGELERQVTAALMQGDSKAAEQLLTQAHNAPGMAPCKIDTKLAADLKSGKTRLYKVKLWDSCAEDGDVVEVLANGAVFSQVAIFNAPHEVVIPVSSDGGGQVTLQGVHDGGGGITLGCETSAGQFFLSVIMPGESIVLNLSL